VDRASSRDHTELLAEDDGNPPVRPPPLAKAADQLGVWLKLASGWLGVGFGEKGGNSVIEVHASPAASTVRL